MPAIYAMSDPRNPKIPRYIGKTKQPLRWRLNGHLLQSSSRPDTPVSKWINELKAISRIPTIWLLEDVLEGNATEREIAWIRFFRPLGTLLNLSDGPGMLGMKHPLPREVYERAARTKTGRKMPEEQRMRWSNHPKIIEVQKTLREYNENKKRPVVSTDGRFAFASVSDAARAIGCHNAVLHAAIINGWRCKRLHWKFGKADEGTTVLDAKEATWTNQGHKLSNDDVQTILNLRSSGISQTAIAKRFGVTQGHVSRLVHGKRRKELCK